MKAQVPAEHLVILSVLLVIAIAALFMFGILKAPENKVSMQYWEDASPISVTRADANGSGLELELINRDIGRLTITGISIGAVPVFSGSVDLDTNQSSVVNATLPAPCGEPGGSFSYNDLTITYAKGNATGLRQEGEEIRGSCS